MWTLGRRLLQGAVIKLLLGVMLIDDSLFAQAVLVD